MNKALHFGAGNIGRGFIGLILNQSGYELNFADVNEQLIDELNKMNGYTVEEIGNQEKSIYVSPIHGYSINRDHKELIEKLCDVNLITTAVGPNILPKIAYLFVTVIEALTNRKSNTYLTIIACENVIGGTDILKSEIYKKLSPTAIEYANTWIGFPNSAVDRIVPAQTNPDSLLVKVEPYFEWIIDENAIKGTLVLKGATLTKNLDAYIQRKLYLVNAGHAAIAYAGFQKSYSTIYDALKDGEIYKLVIGQMREAASLLEQKFNFNHDELEHYCLKTLERFSNPLITDSIFRVGRSPIRKLSCNDRFIKPLLELFDYNLKTDFFEESIRNALKFNYSFDEEAVLLQEMINRNGIHRVLVEVCGLPEDHLLIQKIYNHF